jgi:hypothetical protein
MIARKINSVLVLLCLTVFSFGCQKSTATSNASATSNAPAAVQPPRAEASKTILRVHWLGKKNISADTNAAEFMKIWNLPESVRLRGQTLDKLSSAPWRFLRGQTNSASTNLLRALLDDLADQESYVEVRQATNASAEMVLAIRLDDQRAGLWQTNLAAALESLTGIRPTNSAAVAGWLLKKHHAPNLIEFARAGNWTLLAAAQDHNVLLDETLARIHHADAPFPSWATNSWLEAGGDLARLAAAMGFAPDLGAELPRVSLTVLGEPDHLRTQGEITFPHSEPAKLDAWNIPTNLIDGDFTSFTAIRGLRPWLASSKVWTNLQIGPPPDQFYAWALRAFPVETYFAAPLSDASNAVSRLSDLVLQKGGKLFSTNGLAVFQRSQTYNGLAWHGLPYAAPFLQSTEINGDGFVFGGSFQPEPAVQPLPPALLKEVLGQTNLVYYDWEFTGLRLDQWLHLAQFIRFVSGKAQLPANSAGLAWLMAVGPKLATCGTEITQTGPGQYLFIRNSTVGFTAIELHLLADWLESPEFPTGIHTFMGRPSE